MPRDLLVILIRDGNFDVNFVAEIAHTTIVRKTASALVSHSGVRFVEPHGDAEARLNDMMATFVGKMLAAQKANAGATEIGGASSLTDLGGARRSRTRGYVTYRLQDGAWTRVDGFECR